jgi:hypothetical protein
LHLRKSASILLLIIILFNMVGYRAWFYYAEKRSDAAMEARLDNFRYDENALVSISIPLDNPYQLEQSSFVRINGEISFRGKTFKYVKRKVEDGKLILLCIPDEHKTLLKNAKADYGVAVSDLTSNGKNPSRNNNLQKNLRVVDYLAQLPGFHISNFQNSLVSHNDHYTRTLSDAHLATLCKPPQALS